MIAPSTLPAGVACDLHVAGGRSPAAGDRRFPVEDPATGQVIASVSDASVSDADAALDAAVAAAPSWARTSPDRRSTLLHRGVELLHEHQDDLARIITLESGKPLREAHAEIAYAAGYLRWYAEEAVRGGGRQTTTLDGLGQLVTQQRPVGPCLLVTPWNFPLAMGARKIAPALAAGCTTVVKPAEQTPLTMLAFADLLAQAGAPPGVVNVLPTTQAPAVVGHVMRDPRLRKLSFTGSTEVGRILMRQAADQILRLSLELGGNAPFIVFPDADLEQAAAGAVAAKLRNGGQACTAANRFIVHEAVADEFAAMLAARLSPLRLGRGLDPETDVGPLIDARQHQRVLGLVDDAIARGARVVERRHDVPAAGHFVAPTVLDRVPDTARIVAEEIFGPVVAISTFQRDEEAYERANRTQMGLAAYVYTSDLERGIGASRSLSAGMIAVNRASVSHVNVPFGGIKHSGLGREGGPEGLLEYQETVTLSLPG